MAKRCTVFRAGGYGDVLIAGSTFPHLVDAEYRLTLVTSAKGEEVMRHDPHLASIAIVDVLAMNAGERRDLWAALAGECERFINFSEALEGELLATRLQSKYDWPHALRHARMNGSYLELAHDVAGVPHDYRQRFYATDAERAEARAWRELMPRLVVIAMGGTGVNKFWPGVFEFAWRLVNARADMHVAVIGDLKGGHFLAHERLHVIGQQWPVRQAFALALEADLVIGQETGLLNAVAMEPMPKVALLSHSSPQNLTAHWRNAWPFWGGVDCWPCHRLQFDWSGCRRDAETGAAACQAAIAPARVLDLADQLLDCELRRAA